MSNVAGPQREVFLAGRPVADLHLYGLGAAGLYFGIVTYNGAASAGVTTTASACADPASLARHWATAWEEIKAAVAVAEEAGTLGVPTGDDTEEGVAAWTLTVCAAAATSAAAAAAAVLGWAGACWLWSLT